MTTMMRTMATGRRGATASWSPGATAFPLPFLGVVVLLVVTVTATLPTSALAQGGVTPVGDVKDHPVSPPSPAAARGDDATAAGGNEIFDAEGEAVNLDDMPQENMQSLFNWAIANSDPQKLREMAEAAKKKGGAVGASFDAAAAATSLPDAEAASKVQPGQRWTQEEVEAKRKDVKELLDMLSMNPTEQSYIKLATDMYLNKTLAKVRMGGNCRPATRSSA